MSILRPWIERQLSAAIAARRADGRPVRVVDVGCGNQPFRRLIEAAGADYLSMDVAQNDAGSVAAVGPLDGPDLPPEVRGREFEVVVCTEVLEHVFDWPAAFANLARLTAPGGTVILTCPFFWPLHEVPHDYWRPTPYAIRTAAERAGLAVVSVEPAGDMGDVAGTLVGNARVRSPLPGPIGLILTLCGLVGRRVAYHLLAARWPRRLIRVTSVQGPFYLANLAVLTKRG